MVFVRDLSGVSKSVSVTVGVFSYCPAESGIGVVMYEPERPLPVPGRVAGRDVLEHHEARLLLPGRILRG